MRPISVKRNSFSCNSFSLILLQLILTAVETLLQLILITPLPTAPGGVEVGAEDGRREREPGVGGDWTGGFERERTRARKREREHESEREKEDTEASGRRHRRVIRDLLQCQKRRVINFAPWHIVDKPRFAHRGLLIGMKKKTLLCLNKLHTLHKNSEKSGRQTALQRRPISVERDLLVSKETY